MMSVMRALLPKSANWAAFGISRHEFPMVAEAINQGGHVRVGLEDNLYLDRGVFASNGQLVERAATIASSLGAQLVEPGTPLGTVVGLFQKIEDATVATEIEALERRRSTS